jgi:hypothetical protein
MTICNTIQTTIFYHWFKWHFWCNQHCNNNHALAITASGMWSTKKHRTNFEKLSTLKISTKTFIAIDLEHAIRKIQEIQVGQKTLRYSSILTYLLIFTFECCILLRIYDSLWHRQSQQSFNTLTPFNFPFYSLHVSAFTGHPQVRYTISYYFCFWLPTARSPRCWWISRPKNLEDHPDHHEEIQIRHIKKSVHSS